MIDKVVEFHVKHSHTIRQTPGLITDSQKLLRARLMVEELAELVTAMHEENVIEIADALADLLYVVIGTGIAYGLPITEVFNEVHRSNMSKDRLNRHGKGGKGNGFSPPNLEEILRKAGWTTSV